MGMGALNEHLFRREHFFRSPELWRAGVKQAQSFHPRIRAGWQVAPCLSSAVHATVVKAWAAPSFEASRLRSGLTPSLRIQLPEARGQRAGRGPLCPSLQETPALLMMAQNEKRHQETAQTCWGIGESSLFIWQHQEGGRVGTH